MPKMNTPDAPTIECHPPERRRRSEIRMCHGSCCCCCCCLHTIGGIIGASVAPTIGKNKPVPLTYYYDEEGDVVGVPNIGKAGISAVRVFWLLTLFCAIIGWIGIVGMMLSQPGGRGQIGGRTDPWGSIVWGLVLLVMAFPAVQLVSAI